MKSGQLASRRCYFASALDEVFVQCDADDLPEAAFERKDTLETEAKKGALAGSRSFGMNKRLFIASRSVTPDFKILLFPYRQGEALPETTWSAERTELTIEVGGVKRILGLNMDDSGRMAILAR